MLSGTILHFDILKATCNFVVRRTNGVGVLFIIWGGDNCMRIDKIHIENFGSIKNFEAEFCDKLNVVCSEFWTGILAVLGLVTGSKVIGFNFTRHVFNTYTRIYAALSGNFGKANIDLFYDESEPHCCGRNIILNGKEAAEEDLIKVCGVSLEEVECSVFINEHDYRRYVPLAEYDFTRKLNLYLNYVPKNGNRDIMGTLQFKEVLHGFISSFEPVSINSSKDMWLSITNDGVFVPLRHGEERQDLSAAEQTIFNYLCFAEVNAFWGQAVDKCHIKERLPLYIGDFICFIDEATDITPFISRALALGRQAFLFSEFADTTARLKTCESIKIFNLQQI